MIQKSLPKDTAETRLTSLHTGTLPKRFIFGFVRTKAFTGDLQLNPFNFEHINIEEFKISGGNDTLGYNEAIVMNYSQKDYRSAYNLLFTNLRFAPSGITYENFLKGNTIYALDLSPDLTASVFHFPISFPTQKKAGKETLFKIGKKKKSGKRNTFL